MKLSTDNRKFVFPVRVYYEDTDAGGVVFYANYLKFCERARTEWLRKLGFDQSKLDSELGLIFVVADTSLTYKKPAKLDDILSIHTIVESMGKASIVFTQDVYRDNELLVKSRITVCCIKRDGFRPSAIPESVRLSFESVMSPRITNE
ncbi:tol-pal system-associated acyl-CoA thioesterase [Taylorella equigenitalis]|uniref:Putative thioesterase n=1 Tax=Taylorella equigenitalis 14/56 TaxID=1091497 RepID=I7JJZ1_9BURK|nr:tol-pal system-associated acyl-CoA thioesterase [Taylorella equigenitalis]ASY30133.1 tol-pal system-associated acyl-CoA thioesterase [Taylorella equigenitalis]ASY37439.1 tol-pal system-associated acyl-CoA thioesterase [Taylorella equigenitalis]KGK33412.1 acyl-CoA thioesterase [Taylorella equigenitalis]KOS58623.1 acyl-CoA thioesterase [Taylorella equigenitalis]RBA25929.1 tol-pal system-associated acyl-CoA thioesterase [Taylorella equigenitalis]